MAFTFDRETGARLEGDEDVWQSIEDILTTPKGSRVWNREYGSLLYELIDSNASQARIAGEISDAIEANEPRVRVKSARLTRAIDGEYEVDVEIIWRANEEREQRGIRLGFQA